MTLLFYQSVGDKHGITVYKMEPGCVDEEMYIDNTYSAGGDEIWIGIYDDKDKEIASFFHALGRCISHNFDNTDCYDQLVWHIELDAWMVGLQEAYKYGYLIKPSTFKYMVDTLNTKVDYEEREVMVKSEELKRLIEKFK
jgi:hypothetical protein